MTSLDPRQPPRRVPANAVPIRGLRATRLRLPSAPDPTPPESPQRHRGLRRVGSWAGWGKSARAVALLASLGTGAAAVAAVYITNQTLDATRQQNAVTEQGQYTERFGRAIDQLGSDKADIRLGGIYALERLSNDSPRDAGTITNVLAGFVRNNAHCPSPPATTSKAQLPTDIGAVLTVLTRRPASDPPSRDPSVVQADMKGACLSHLDFRLYDLANIDLGNADLSDSNLFGLYMAGVSLTGANLAGTRLTDSVWLGTIITSGNLTGADLAGAVLHNTKFAGTNLQRAVLDRARRDETTLRSTTASSYIDLNKILDGRAVAPDFYAADLSSASLREVNLPGASFVGASLDNTNFTQAQLPKAIFTAAKSLRGTTFDHASLTGAAFHGLDLRQANFIDADLSYADLSDADLRGVDLSRTNLTGADFSGAQR